MLPRTAFHWLPITLGWVHLVVPTIIPDPREAPAGVFESTRKIEIARTQVMLSGQI